jgi:hypothetical protein
VHLEIVFPADKYSNREGVGELKRFVDFMRVVVTGAEHDE